MESIPTVAVDGARIAYRRIAHGRPLLVLNGFAATSADWDPSFIDRLASFNELILLDNRGMGRSTDNGRPFDIAQLADDATRVIEILGIERTSLLGWSMGGFIAQTLALQHPGGVLTNSSCYRPIAEEPTQIELQPRYGHNSSICPGRLKNGRVDCCHWFFRVTSRSPFIANSAISWQPRRWTRGTALASGTCCEKCICPC